MQNNLYAGAEKKFHQGKTAPTRTLARIPRWGKRNYQLTAPACSRERATFAHSGRVGMAALVTAGAGLLCYTRRRALATTRRESWRQLGAAIVALVRHLSSTASAPDGNLTPRQLLGPYIAQWTEQKRNTFSAGTQIRNGRSTRRPCIPRMHKMPMCHIC